MIRLVRGLEGYKPYAETINQVHAMERDGILALDATHIKNTQTGEAVFPSWVASHIRSIAVVDVRQFPNYHRPDRQP